MAGSTSNDLYQVFLQVSGQQAAGLSDVRYALEEVIAQMGIVRQTALPAQAAKPSSAPQSSGGNSDSTLTQVLKSGLGVAPLIGGLIGLFSGGTDEPAPLVKYAMPATVSFDAASQGGQITMADSNQMGMARAYPSSAGSQVTVNVQAMDARSFMDRSGDIAMAVRDAMLNLNSINDVVNDL